MSVASESDEDQGDNEEASDSGVSRAQSPNAAAFRRAADLIRAAQGPDGGGASRDIASEQQQIKALVAEGVLPSIPDDELEALPLISDKTSEHKVWSLESDHRVVKMTWAGSYGQIPVLVNGKLDRRMATPSEYLVRQALQIEVFASTIQLEGVNISQKPSLVLFAPSGQPSFVISQEVLVAANPNFPNPTDFQIAQFLEKSGFEHSPGSYFGWIRGEDGVAIVDARPDNFIVTSQGVIPIDLQMALVDLF